MPWSSECIAMTNGKIQVADNGVRSSAFTKYVDAFI